MSKRRLKAKMTIKVDVNNIMEQYGGSVSVKTRNTESTTKRIIDVYKKIDSLLEENRKYKIIGNIHNYQCNCLKIEGMNIALGILGLSKS